MIADISSNVDAYGNVSSAFNVAAATGNITILVPSGTVMQNSNGSALNSSMSIGITTPNSTVSASLGSTESIVAKGVELGPAGATFSPYIQIRFNYTDEDISGIDEDALAVKFYNQSTSQWDVQTTYEHNKTGNYIIANIEHFSTFAITGTTPATTPITSTSGGGGTGGVLRITNPVVMEEENTTASDETTTVVGEVEDGTDITDGIPTAAQTEDEEEKKGIPGFEAILAISGLLAVALYTRHGSRKY
jgi:hypothetical protein